MVIVFSVFGCDEESDNYHHSITGDVVYPLAIGNYWIYNDTTFVYGDTLVHQDRYDITGREIIQYVGEEWEVYHIEYTSSTYPEWEYPINLYQNSSEGFWNFGYYSSYDTLIYPSLIYKYPIIVGSKWNHITTSNVSEQLDTLIYDCLSDDTVFTTPLGSFNCYVYHYSIPTSGRGGLGICPNQKYLTTLLKQTTNDTAQIYIYCTPGIGLIGGETYIDSLVSKSVLSEYGLNNSAP